MTMLETHKREALRRRFGWMADQACHTAEDRDPEPAPRKKGADDVRHPARRQNDTFYWLGLWAMVSCQVNHLTPH